MSVPGCVDGWAELHERFGKLPFAEVVQIVAQSARARCSRSVETAFMRLSRSSRETSRSRRGPMPSTQNEPSADPKYIARRIALYEDRLNAVITVNPHALQEADDRELVAAYLEGHQG
mgnify:CR=1 FL=1